MPLSKTTTADIPIGLAAGLFATAAIGPIQNLLYRLMPRSVKQREEEVRPGSPTTVAAKKIAAAAGDKLSTPERSKAATAIHYAAGIPWGAAYTLLRRKSGMTPAAAALATGGAMFLILDEALTPAMGFSAPDRDYPAATHIRSFVAHLAFGALAGAAAEILYDVSGTRPSAPER